LLTLKRDCILCCIISQLRNHFSSYVIYFLCHFNVCVHYLAGPYKYINDPVTVFPERSYSYGEKYSSRAHFPQRSFAEQWHKNVEYLFKFGDKNVKLVLTRNELLVSPQIVVQHYNGSLTWLEENSSGKGLSCFYEGHVNGATGSRVAVNLCDGLVSLLCGIFQEYLAVTILMIAAEF